MTASSSHRRHDRRRVLKGGLAALAAPAVVGAASTRVAAQAWPSKPVRVVIPFGAGSATDVIPRQVLDRVGAVLGQTFVVENRPGAGSTTGTQAIAKAEPDGYSFLATSSAYAIAPAMYEKLGYDPVKDLVGVAHLGGLANVLIVPASEPWRSVQEFVAAAKGKAGGFNFASLGAGSGVHLAAERFRMSAGFEATQVAFRSGAEALTEIVAGRIQYYTCPVGTALPFIRDGKVRGLAITNPKRVAALPDLPTTLEAGYKDSDTSAWLGMFAPKDTPAAIIERLHAEVAKALAEPAFAASLVQQGVEAEPLTPSQFTARVAADIGVYGSIVRQLGLKPT
jgi:tripartite-type tricarboxylate transporter receptor subunit TctC